MHGSGGEKWKRSRHMWPVPNSTATTVAAQSDLKSLDFFCKDGRKIQVGDCALFKPPQESPPFIGIIRRLTLDAEDTLSLGVNWLYRPADIRLAKGIALEAAPNEVFYSFHKDEILAASLLHPCKVAFLRKGVELPPGISSYVCRRVYDVESKRLWWLTDKDYINERQEEVDQLIDKTRLEMHGAVQSGGRSPKPLNGPSSTPQLKSGSDSVQNSASSFSSQAKGKKRERGVDQGSDSVKRERLLKTEDGDSGQFRPEVMLKSEIAKITDKGGLVDSSGVEKLIQLMQPDSPIKKLDLAGRIMLADVISVTERFDYLERFVQLKGLSVLDEWLQEVHKGKIGDGSSPKESDRSVEEFLLALLRALDKLPVNLHALQNCNVGKSVNYLRSHKNSEIQKKARSLVDTWKRRVEAEMNMNDAKSGSARGVSWQNKPVPSEVSQVGTRKLGNNTAEVGLKGCTTQPSVPKTHPVKVGPGDTVPKSTPSPGSTKLASTSVGPISKDQNFRMLVGAASSDLPLSSIKEEKSSSSSQSQNNSQSSEHAKTVGSSYREDARSSTAGSVSASKVSNSASRHRKSSNGHQGSAGSGVQKETGPGKVNPASRSLPAEKLLTAGASQEKIVDGTTTNDQGTNRLIVRFPNTGRSPARGSSGVSFEEPVGKGSPPPEKHDTHDKKTKARNDICQSKDGGFEENHVLPGYGEQQRASDDGDKPAEVSKVAGSMSKMPRSVKSYDASFSINALIESCAKISQASASTSPGDDVGMNLLASVAAGEISKSGNASPSSSPGRNPSTPDGSSSGNDGKFKQGEDVAQVQFQPSGGALPEFGNACESLCPKNESRHPNGGVEQATNDSGESKNALLPSGGERTGECTTPHLDGSSSSQQNVAVPVSSDYKPSEEHDPVIPREGRVDADGAFQIHEQRKSGIHRTKSMGVSDPKPDVHAPVADEDKKPVCADERTVENGAVKRSEAASDSAKVEKDNEKSTCSSSETEGEDQNSDKDSANDQKPSVVAVTHSEPLEGKVEDPVLGSDFGHNLDAAIKGEKGDDVKSDVELQPSASEHDKECRKENSEVKDSVGHLESSVDTMLPKQESEDCENPNKLKTDAPEPNKAEERQLDTNVMLDFDLNEGFSLDDSNHGDNLVKPGDSTTGPSSSAIHLPCPLPFQNSSISVGFPASITVAAPAKGAFNLPENPLRSKSGELGWKGSAATSAFRPAEPRKTSDVVIESSASKPVRAPLDFDLNVADEVADEDEPGPSNRGASGSAGGGGLGLDLNELDENPDSGHFSPRPHSKPETVAALLNNRSSNGAASVLPLNMSRNFDLNDGPSLDDSEAAPRVQPAKHSIVPVPLPVPVLVPPQVVGPGPGPGPPVHGMRVSNNAAEYGNFSPWFPAPANAYSAITVPPIFTSRGGEQSSYVPPPAGSQRVLCPPAASSSSFSHEIYRGGPVLSSSPAVAFQNSAQIPYPGFPFETGFPLSSSSFPGGYNMDSSSGGGGGGAICFPTIPSSFVGPGGLVPSGYPRPYVMNLQGGGSGIGPDGRKWGGGGGGLDLNAGPGGVDERLPSGVRQISVPSSQQALMEEQLKMFHVGSGGVLKRKEPDGGLDSVDRINYKQPSWQ